MSSGCIKFLIAVFVIYFIFSVVPLTEAAGGNIFTGICFTIVLPIAIVAALIGMTKK